MHRKYKSIKKKKRLLVTYLKDAVFAGMLVGNPEQFTVFFTRSEAQLNGSDEFIRLE